MEHIFILKGLDCPNCSAKIEKEVGELEGVQLSSMNLMKQTLTVQAEASVTNLLDTVTTIVHSHEPDVPCTLFLSRMFQADAIGAFGCIAAVKRRLSSSTIKMGACFKCFN